MTDLNEIGQRARAAARVLAIVSSEQKNAALHLIARALRARMDAVLDANSADMQHGRALGMSAVLLDRLLLNPQRLDALAGDVERVAGLPDPVGERFESQALPSGLHVHKRRVPFGVVGMIYEARPTVTVDAATVCLKAGNATILRGGSETQHSNMALTALLRDALAEAGLPADIVQTIDSPDRALVRQLLRLDQYVDVLIPRGSASLNQFCRQHSTIPVITGGSGVCHIYVDQAADLDQALPIIANSKVVQPTACNTLETLLVHRAVAARLLPVLAADLLGRGVELRVDEQAMDVLHDAGLSDERVVPAQASDFGTEFMALILAVRVVDGLDAAVEHIARYGTGHSDAVLSADPAVAEAFVRAVDSAAVLVNASLRFNDAGQLGLGAEIAISNQKLHVRGPMALRELTTYKWVLEGVGQIRP